MNLSIQDTNAIIDIRNSMLLFIATMEEYTGLIILASNFKSNVDDAILRRFQNIIHFPKPKAE